MRILLIKLSSMGDVIHNLPVVTDIQRKHPDALIDWMTEAPYAALATQHPGVNQVIPLHLRALKQRWYAPGNWLQLFDDKAAVARARYDLVLDTQGLVKSAVVANWANGPLAGYDRDSIREPFATRWYDRTHAVSRALHAVTRNRLLASAALGTDASTPVDYGVATAFAPDAAVPGKPYVVCLTASSRADKCWPTAHWIELGTALHAAGFAVVLPAGSAAEFAVTQHIAATLSGKGVDAKATAPGALIEVAQSLAQAQAVVGVDTGLAHLAVALNRPTVGLYLSTMPALTGLHGENAVNLGGGSRNAPTSLTAAEVMTALESLLAQKASGP